MIEEMLFDGTVVKANLIWEREGILPCGPRLRIRVTIHFRFRLRVGWYPKDQARNKFPISEEQKS